MIMPHVTPKLSRRALLPLALICVGAAGAQTGPVTTFEIDSTKAFNIGGFVSAAHDFGTYSYGTTDIQNLQYHESTHSVIQTPPGIGTTGLVLDYLDRTYSYDEAYTVAKSEAGFISMTATDAQAINFGGEKYFQVTGHLSATQDTGVTFGLHANGSYLPFGQTTPALPNFYLSANGVGISPFFSDTTTNPNDTPGSYSLFAQTSNQTLLANTPFSFTAMICAGDNVSLQDFRLQIGTDYYDLTTTITPKSNTTSELIGSHVLAAVPEPETYAMFLGGLALVGCLSRRQRRVQPL
jgi:hypothetical protein